MIKHGTTFLFLVFLLGAPGAALAGPYGFACVSNNNPANCATLEAQLQLSVSSSAPGVVDFTLSNSGPGASSITDVYFDDTDPALLGGTATIQNGPGVSFSVNCSPTNLPSGSLVNFVTSYCADSNSPVQPQGVNPGEWLQISYALQPNGGQPATFQDVLDAMDSGSYRVGVHVQGFADGGGESAVATATPVPEPGSLLLMGTGLLAAMRKRFVKRSKA